MTLSSIIYADSQRQSIEPIGYQEPIPEGVHSIELSWDRSAKEDGGLMRIIINKKAWWWKQILGSAIITSTDSEKGRMHLNGMALIDGEQLILHRPPNAKPHEVVVGEHLEKTNNRLCYFREERTWRLRNERMGDVKGALRLVSGYVGDIYVEWHKDDPWAHVFHKGWTIIDEQNVAHLYDPNLTYPSI